MRRSPRYCLLALCLSLVGAGEVAAAPSWLELRWTELAGCPTRDEVEATTLRLTAGAAPQPVTAEAVLTADPAGYHLQLRVRDASGEQRRTLHSARCEALADTTAVIVAVAAAPVGVAAKIVAAPPPSPRLEPEPSPGPRVVEAELELPPPAPAPAPASSWRRPGLALGFAATAGLGPSRRFAAGLSGDLALLWRRARLDLRGSGWLPSPVRDPARPEVGADLRLAAGALRGGPRVVRGSLAFEPSGGLELGALLARGVGLADNDRSRGLWAAGLLALGLRWQPLRWFSLALEVEGLVAFTRRRYTVRDADPFYTVPPLGLRLGGGIAVHIF